MTFLFTQTQFREIGSFKKQESWHHFSENLNTISKKKNPAAKYQQQGFFNTRAIND
jgi:hypothetical protein